MLQVSMFTNVRLQSELGVLYVVLSSHSLAAVAGYLAFTRSLVALTVEVG